MKANQLPYFKPLFAMALFLGLLRLVLLFHHNPNLIMNIDEESNYDVATNYLKGLSYSYIDPDKNIYLPTAFHASGTIFIYKVLLKNKIHKRKWVTFCNILSAVLLVISVFYFYRIALLLLPAKWAFGSTVLYGIYPSVVYYIGTLFWYEQIVLSLLIIAVYKLIQSFSEGFKWGNWALILLCVIIGTTLRIQTLAVFFPLLLVAIAYAFKRTNFKLALSYIGIILLGFASQVPAMQKNKVLFGTPMLSTQFGYELMQGHNPLAKGSWMGNWLVPGTPLYIYAAQQIPNIKELNQYEEGLARKQVAIQWIKANPLQDLKLEIRKLALFFAPFNFEFLPYNHFPNPINLLVSLGFLGYCVGLLWFKKREKCMQQLLLLIPIAASLGLTVLFFMGARWRYYAEPFMIILAVYFVYQFSQRYKKSAITA